MINQVSAQRKILIVGSDEQSAIQEDAVDLYQRGLNVFPVPRPEEIKELAKTYPDKFSPNNKMPYILKPLFYSRMHLCSEYCRTEEKKTGKKCSVEFRPHNFRNLFTKANLAVMLGRTSGNLVCIDCDEIRAFNHVLKEFDYRNLSYWAYQTSRGGNILFRLTEGEAKNSPKNAIAGVEIWGNQHFCILPPSIHPSGIVYTWSDGVDPRIHLSPYEPIPLIQLEDLLWLGIEIKKERNKPINLYGLPTWTNFLSVSNRKILAEPIFEGDRNKQLSKAVYDVAAAIKSGLIEFVDGQNLLLEAANKCIPPYPINQIMSMLKSASQKSDLSLAKEYYDDKNKKDIVRLEQARFFLGIHDWGSHGRSGNTDWAVFAACIQRSEMDNDIEFRASAREVASLANIQKPETVSHSLQRLISKGILEFVNITPCGAYQYRFGKTVQDINRYINKTSNPNVPNKNSSLLPINPITYFEKDLFSKLGKVAWRILRHLQVNHESKRIDISRNTGLNYQSVLKQIPRLLDLGLISYSCAEGVFIGEILDETKIQELVDHLGVTGRSKRRDERFLREREENVNRQIYQARRRFAGLLESHSGAIEEV